METTTAQATPTPSPSPRAQQQQQQQLLPQMLSTPSPSMAIAYTTGRSLDQQVDNDISPNNSNYSNLSNSSSNGSNTSPSSSSTSGRASESSSPCANSGDGRVATAAAAAAAAAGGAASLNSSTSSSSAPQYSEDVRRRSSGATAGATGATAVSSGTSGSGNATSRHALDLLPRQGSGSSSTKTCEVDLGDEERDTFSPVSSNQCSPCEPDVNGVVRCNGSTDDIGGDNKVYTPPASQALLPPTHKYNGFSTLMLPSKEEKQRQNEEIVCMETSTISSETGSWESVYPQQQTQFQPQATILTTVATVSMPLDGEEDPSSMLPSKSKSVGKLGDKYLLEDAELSAYPRERTYSTGAAVSADTSSLFKGISSSSLLREFDKQPLSTSGTSGCFIDASSLRDEDEVLSFPSLDGQHTSEEPPAVGISPQLINVHNGTKSTVAAVSTNGELEDSPTTKLEEFHKSFARCKNKTKPKPEPAPDDEQVHGSSYHNTSNSVSSHSGAESPQKDDLDITNNLSDEEKLWKRGQQQPIAIKDAKATPQSQQLSNIEDLTEASVSLAADVDSSDSSMSGKIRREQSHKQLPFSFQHNMQHFSIHPLGTSPKFTTHHGTNSLPGVTTVTVNATPAHMHNDLSYTTDYSSSSPAPSLVWSEHEQKPNIGPVSMRQQQQQQLQQQQQRVQTQNVDIAEVGSKLLTGTHLPDTPHNSIIHIEPMSSNTSSIHRDYTLSSSLSHHRDSGAYCSDATDSPIPMPRTPKRSKFDESNPIVSGGASIEDFNIKQCESPSLKRRTDTCPIVCGGFVSLDFERTRPLHDEDDDDDDGDIDEEVELRAKPKTRKPIPGIASWVVDMSDCRPERRKSTSSTSSMETPVAKFRERSDSTSSHKSGCGFYVSLDDMDKKPQEKAPVTVEMSKSYTAPKSAGFFVNLSQSEYQANKIEDSSQPEESAAIDKKSIFSMFIDFGNDKKSRSGLGGKKEPFNLAQRLSSSLSSTHKRVEEAVKSSASSTETLMAKSANLKYQGEDNESKSLDYKCNLDAPVTVAAIRRISLQQRAQIDPAKRHSWGTNHNQSKETSPAASVGDCKRSISLTANGDCKENGNGLMSIIDKLPIISKASSLSVDSSLSPYDDYGGSKSGLSTCSNNSARNSMSGGERDEEGVANPLSAHAARMKKRRRDVQINETFDKSSVASITDGLLSKDLSPASNNTDTDDLTFQQDEELALREAAMQPSLPPLQLGTCASNRSSAIIMETIIEAKETSSPKKSVSTISNGHTMESLHATIEKQKMLLETVNEHGEVEKSSFVKLSDMDKPVKHELNSPDSMSKSAGNHRQINRLFRDDTKTRPHSWSMTRSTGNSFLNITNSVDNLRSLTRLFPNFSKEFSNSLPNDIVLDQMDYIQTDLSADSSLASSFSRSGMDESSISCRQPRRLGEDLLKMFLQEIATDMIVEVHGRRIKAHKCILRSRCQYFAAMLAGTGAQSVVSLQGYSYSAVNFALYHIYSGASHPPDGISLMELAALADLLGLEGLKEVTSHALKTNYCHNFHKPCSGCIDGILQVLPVALNHALDDLYRKCLRWTCRHYLKVWPTRQFAQLPPDILGRCRQQIVAYLTSETVLDTVLDCDQLLGQLSAYRWGGICENLVRDILDAAYIYIAEHFASLIASDAFLSLGHDRSRHIPHLEGLLLRTAASLTPDQACRSYQRITRLNTVLQAKIIQMPANLGVELVKELQGLQEEDLEWEPDYIRLVSALLSAVEQCLIRQCSRAMRVTAWQRMDLELRKKIQTLARLTEPLDMKRNSKPVSKAFSFGGSTRSQDLIQVKLAIQAHSKRTLAQDTQLYKATQTQDVGQVVQTTERGVQANNDMREGNSRLLKSNSRAHVPQSYRASSQSVTNSERNSMNNGNHYNNNSNNSNNNNYTHRRTQSEAPPITHKSLATSKPSADAKATAGGTQQTPKSVANRLSEVRPRYLEPRKTRSANATAGPIRSATSSSIPAIGSKGRGLHISSSDSSRNSSPAARRNVNGKVTKVATKSTHMSMDSLASPARRAKSAPRGKSSDTERYSDVNVDSLAESMKSSMITNKTISHESLSATTGHATSANRLSRTHQLNNNNGKNVNPKAAITKVTLRPHNNNNAVTITNITTTTSNTTNATTHTTTGAAMASNRSTRQLKLQHQHNHSNGSSPSSVHTTKSATSRLSSVSSTQSTRDLFKQRSISVPAGEVVNGQQPQQKQKHSFLSAKSREILAKRAEKNKQQQQQQQHQHQHHQQANSSGDELVQPRNGHQHSLHVPTGPLRSASHSAVSSYAASAAKQAAAQQQNLRNSMPSNIPTRRPNTLQLKKTTAISGGSLGQHKANVVAATNAKNSKLCGSAPNGTDTLKAAHAVKQKLELLIDATMHEIPSTRQRQVDTPPPMRQETKLERSSTFCKEGGGDLDLDGHELQIIE